MNRLVWFRNDLRIHDNEALSSALGDARGTVAFTYIFDEQWNAETLEGYPRMGGFRKRFLAESLIELREKLRVFGAELICVRGDPVEVLPQMCEQLDIHEVFYMRLSAFDERQQETNVERRLDSKGIRCFSFSSHTLLRKEDLPNFDFTRPASYSKLRNAVEPSWPIRMPIAAPTHLVAKPNKKIPSDVWVWKPEYFLGGRHVERGFRVSGGETQALDRVGEYFWKTDQLRRYKETRNGLLALNDSSKLSPALSLGCVSARFLYAEVRRYEQERVANSSTRWFLYELLWRDHFNFAALRRGAQLFTDISSQAPLATESAQKKQTFESWRQGKTGNTFIDCAMTELHLTGWMSNRMRQNAASYLVHNLKGDWRSGARWFETCLIDYDPASNWGNWSYIAGAGSEHKPHIFDVNQQAAAYDPNGEYIKFWSSISFNL